MSQQKLFFTTMIAWVSLLALVLLLPPTRCLAEPSALAPIRILCGGGEMGGNPFSTLEFELRNPTGRTSQQTTYARSYSFNEFPIKSYRTINIPQHTFRISAELKTEEYREGNRLLRLAIFEETSDQMLIQRYSNNVALTELEEPFRFGYQVPNSRFKISCHIYWEESKSSQKVPPKAKERFPAKTNSSH